MKKKKAFSSLLGSSDKKKVFTLRMAEPRLIFSSLDQDRISWVLSTKLPTLLCDYLLIIAQFILNSNKSFLIKTVKTSLLSKYLLESAFDTPFCPLMLKSLFS